jgi:hypothetical protein
MAIEALREFLHQYRASHTAYLSCVHAVSDACLNGGSPDLSAEAKAYDEFASARQALLGALKEHLKHLRKDKREACASEVDGVDAPDLRVSTSGGALTRLSAG